MKRDELVEIIQNQHKEQCDFNKLADAILAWHEKELEPLRAVYEFCKNGYTIEDNRMFKTAIKTVLGE